MSPRLCAEGACTESVDDLANRPSQYFIDSNSACRSGCDGRSLEKAWKSPVEAQRAGLPTGADVCLMEGSVFEDTYFKIDWGGSANDRAVIGTCYEQSGAVHWWWEGPRARAAAKAEINGTFDRACIKAGYDTCAPTGSGHVPSNSQGLVELDGGSYVTLRAFKVMDSAGRGVRFLGSNYTRNHLEDLEIENLYDSNFFHLGWAPSTRHIVRNNVFLNAGYRYSQPWNPKHAAVGGTCFMLSRGTHGDKVTPAYGLFEGNITGNCSGEAAFLDSSHHIIRGNIFYNTRNTGIYLDNVAHSVVEWNITFLASDSCDIYSGNGNCGPDNRGSSAQGGARWQIEDYPAGCTSPQNCKDTTDAEDNVVRHNLYIWGEEGWGGSMEKHADAGNILALGKYFMHNTTYMATIRPWMDGNTHTQQLQSGMEVINNIVIGSDTASGARCRGNGDRPNYEYNAWGESANALDEDCAGPGDEFGVNPGFRSPNRSGPPRVANRPTFEKYVIVGGDGHGNAKDLSGEIIPEIAPDCSDFPQFSDMDPTWGPEIRWAPTCSNWRKKAFYDYRGQARGERSDKGI